jgi:hypothetical protein
MGEGKVNHVGAGVVLTMTTDEVAFVLFEEFVADGTGVVVVVVVVLLV